MLRFYYLLICTTTTMASFDPKDPNHLAALVYGLCGETFKTYQKKKPPSSWHAQEVLDSIAHLALSKETGQHIAVGAIIDGEHIKLVVADNDERNEPKVVEHIQHIMDSLRKIRLEISPDELASLGSMINSLSANVNSPVHRQLHELEDSVIKHQQLRFWHVLAREGYYNHFTQLVRRCGDSNVKQPPGFESLRQGMHASMLNNLADLFECLPLLFQDNVGVEKLCEVEGLTVKLSRFVSSAGYMLYLIPSDERQLSGPNLLDLCSKYHFETTNTIVNFRDWFLDLMVPHMHFRRLADSALSKRMSYFVDCQVLSVKPRAALEQSPVYFTINAQSIGSVLKDAGWTPKFDPAQPEKDILEIEKEIVGKLFAQLPWTFQADETERKFTMASTVGPHAECLVLDEICHEVAASYIGTSGTSCRLCELYFGARINIDWCIVHCGPPMEGQENCMPTEWRVPDMAEGRLRDYFRKKMLAKLREKAELMEVSHQAEERDKPSMPDHFQTTSSETTVESSTDVVKRGSP